MSNATLPYALKVVFGIINSFLEEPVQEEDLIISLPMYVQGDLNTKITIRPKLHTRKYGNFEFLYNRVDISTLEDLETFRGTANSVQELIPSLNTPAPFNITLKYQVTKDVYDVYEIAGKLDPVEFQDYQLGNFGNNPSMNVLIKAKPNSYLYTGEVVVKVKKNP